MASSAAIAGAVVASYEAREATGGTVQAMSTPRQSPYVKH